MALLKTDMAEQSVVKKKISVTSLLESLLAGTPARQIQLALDQLPTRAKRQAVLCTACGIREEVGESCRERADEISELLAANCDIYDASRKPCMLQNIYGGSLVDLR